MGSTLAEQDRDRQVSAIVRAVQHEHVLAFQRAKTAIGSRAFGPKITEDCPELRELVHGLVDLSDALERCRYALEIRELEAIATNTLMYFGAGMWKRANFEKALTMDPAEIKGRAQPAAARPAASRGGAFSAANAYFDSASDNEQRGT